MGNWDRNRLFLDTINSTTAERLLYMVDHTIIYRDVTNKAHIRNVEREAIKVVNGEKATSLVSRYSIAALENLYYTTYRRGLSHG